MISTHNQNKPTKKGLILRAMGVTIIISIMVNRFFFAHPEGIIEQLGSRVIAPFLWVQQSLVNGIQHVGTYWKSIDSIRKERDMLFSQRNELLSQTIQLKASLNHLEATQELRSFNERYNPRMMVTSQVLMRTLTEHEHSWYVDKGSSSGIRPDMIVTYHTCLVGKVVEVFPRYSKVQLITDRSFKVAVYADQTNTTGIYQGTNTPHEAALTHVGHLEHLQNGEMLISSGQGLIFPRGFAVGTIKEYTVQGVHYRVKIEPFVDVMNTTHCVIMGKE